MIVSRNFKLLVPALILTFLTSVSYADVKLPKIFGSNMVLQQGIEISVWGWADKNENITVSLDGKSVKIKADNKGSWQVKLPAMEYGGPYTLTVKGKNLVEFTNVMIGEVWICSGQSNMDWSIYRSNHAKMEIASANYPDIRLFQVPKGISETPKTDIANGEWKVCSPENIPDFSAVGYFFGKKLFEKLNVPVGLIQTTRPGSVAETWISPRTIKDDPDFSAKLLKLQSTDLKKEYEVRENKIKELFEGEIPKKDIGILDGIPVWADVNLDDSKWGTIKVPGLWEKQGYKNFDGIAYYRYKINLNPEQSRQPAVLHLGMVDDYDITWMNGIQIGNTNVRNLNRVYTIGTGILKPGKNVLTVRVVDNGENGGIWGNPKDQYLMIGDEKFDISGDWKFRFGKPIIHREFTPYAYPTVLYNAMINPIIPYGIKGVIWYQGEANRKRALQYQRIFPALINDWRSHWQLGDFPFIWVQLPNYSKPVDEPAESEWAELREAQAMALKLPNTGMATAIDIGEANNLHPGNKQDVGKRFALNALKIAYNKEVVHQGPMFSSIKFIGQKVYVTFECFGSELIVKNRYGYVNGFSIAGPDNKFYWAQARIVSENQVEVFSDKVTEPSAVRYGWADNPDDLNLYNKEGLPASPFRSQ